MGYQSSEEQARDNHSSAYMLLIFGSAGLVADAVVFFVNPLHMPVFNQYLSLGVMGALFILFIVMGALSMKSYRRLHVKAAEENTLKETLEKWCRENLTTELIDEQCGEDGQNPENEDGGVYFARTAYMKSRIQEKFLNLDEDLLDHFIDTFYTELYGEQSD
jgi:hypothetical protein